MLVMYLYKNNIHHGECQYLYTYTSRMPCSLRIYNLDEECCIQPNVPKKLSPRNHALTTKPRYIFIVPRDEQIIIYSTSYKMFLVSSWAIAAAIHNAKRMRINKRIVNLFILVLTFLSYCSFCLIVENHFPSCETRYESSHRYHHYFVADRVLLPVNILEGQKKIALLSNDQSLLSIIKGNEFEKTATIGLRETRRVWRTNANHSHPNKKLQWRRFCPKY